MRELRALPLLAGAGYPPPRSPLHHPAAATARISSCSSGSLRNGASKCRPLFARGGRFLPPSPSLKYRRSMRCRCSSSAEQRMELFSRIAPVYDNLNVILSLNQHHVWKRMCISWARVKNGDQVLDLCCGSGDLTFLLSQKVGSDGQVTGLDFSSMQLSVAVSRQEKCWKTCYKNIRWLEGDAHNLPFADSSFDAVTIGYGLRNVLDRPKVLGEVLRVLKPGSRASILDFNKSTSAFTRFVQDWLIDNVVVPAGSFYGLTEEYKYLKGSIAEYLTGNELEDLCQDVGFADANHYEIAGGLMGVLVAAR